MLKVCEEMLPRSISLDRGEPEETIFIDHVVLRSDTLQGNNFKALAVLKIPVDPNIHTIIQQPGIPDVKMQKFKNATGESDNEAKIYLDEVSWDVEMAISNWRCDEQWVGRDNQNSIPNINSQDLGEDEETAQNNMRGGKSRFSRFSLNKWLGERNSAASGDATVEVTSQVVVVAPTAIVTCSDGLTGNRISIETAEGVQQLTKSFADNSVGLSGHLLSELLDEMAREPLIS